MNPTKKEYEKYLNEFDAPDTQDISSRHPKRILKKGSWLRRYDSTAFEIGFQEFTSKK